MPDGDIFQRSFRGSGKGWVSIFKALDFDPMRAVGPALEKAAANNLRQLPATYIGRVLSLLTDALVNDLSSNQFNGRSSSDIYVTLNRRLNLMDYGGAFEMSCIVVEAAKAVFATSQSNRLLTKSQISEKFADALASKLFDSRVSKCRNLLQTRKGRSVGEQASWELGVRNQMIDGMRQMIDNYLSSHRPVFRAPANRKSALPTMSELLTRPLNVIAQ